MNRGTMNKWMKRIEIVLAITLVGAAAFLAIFGAVAVFKEPTIIKTEEKLFFPPDEIEDYSEDENKICRVTYLTENGEQECAVDYTYAEWETLDRKPVKATVYEAEDGSYVAFVTAPTDAQLAKAFRDYHATEQAERFNLALALGLAGIAIGIMLFWGKFFTRYEKIWFLSVLVLASIFAIIFPEEDCNGISGILIMALYLADTLLNILCELLISKQSKWNFIVSVFVELTEIAICLVLSYRFATMATTLFFWLPIDIVSFINWHKHPDREEEELTVVRRLHGWQEVLILVGIAVWTIVVGYLLTGLDFTTDLFGGNKTLETVVCYLDACASAVGIANGLFIFFRIREQWIAWYVCAILEAVINILSGQYVLLVLKAGYLTNTTYGYIRWSKYIKTHSETANSKSIL